MDATLFHRFRDLILRESGISLGEEKRQLLANRIQKRLRALSISQPGEYFKMLELDVDGDELINLIDVVSTNVTFFYRESDHFLLLPRIFDECIERGRRDLKIWCAASSSGEEVYTIAMMLEEHPVLRDSASKILGTDISFHVLRKAVRGIYRPSQAEKLPEKLRRRFLHDTQYEGQPALQIDPSLKDRTVFKRLNLAKFPYPLKGPLDLIFCRNVMIYFDVELRQKIINEFSRLLRPGGLMFLSHSENLLGVEHSFQPYAVAVYRKPWEAR